VWSLRNIQFQEKALYDAGRDSKRETKGLRTLRTSWEEEYTAVKGIYSLSGEDPWGLQGFWQVQGVSIRSYKGKRSLRVKEIKPRKTVILVPAGRKTERAEDREYEGCKSSKKKEVLPPTRDFEK